MTKEVRLLAITNLTILIYALSIFFDKGAFLFPFPLNQLIIFIVSSQFAFWNFKKFKIESILMILIGLFLTLGNEVYWSMVLNYEQMTIFSEAIYTDIFQLIASILVLFLAFRFSQKTKNRIQILLLIVFCALFILGNLHPSTLFASFFFLLSYAAMSISTFIKPIMSPINLYWVLLLTLEASKLISIGLNK